MEKTQTMPTFLVSERRKPSLGGEGSEQKSSNTLEPYSGRRPHFPEHEAKAFNKPCSDS